MGRRLYRRWFGAIITFLLLATPGLAADYYCDSDLTDTNPASATPDCTTYNPDGAAGNCTGGTDDAFATIADIDAINLGGGDSVYLRCGSEWRESWTLDDSGTIDVENGWDSTITWLTITSFGTGAMPKINGTVLVTGWTLTADQTNTYQSDFTPSEALSQDSIYLGAIEDGTVLKRQSSIANVEANARSCFYDTDTDIMYVHCTDSADPDTHTMELTDKKIMFHIVSNDAIDFSNIHIYGGQHAIYAIGGATHNRIHHTWTEKTTRYHWDMVDTEGDPDIDYWEVYNNILYDFGLNGMIFIGSEDVRIYNNLIYTLNNYIDTVNLLDGVDDACNRTNLKNNIIVDIDADSDEFFDFHTGQGHVVDYNLYYRTVGNYKWSVDDVDKNTWADWLSDSSQDANSPTPADPKFTDPTNEVFTFNRSSPCFDAGANVGSPYNNALWTGSAIPNVEVTTVDQNDYGSAWEIGPYAQLAYGPGWTNPSSSKTYTILVGDQTVSSAQDWDDLIIVGDLALNAGCDTSTLDYVRITGDVTINAAGETVTFNDVVYFGTKTVTAGTLTEAGNDDYVDPPRDIYLDVDATGKNASNATGLSDDPWIQADGANDFIEKFWPDMHVYYQSGDTWSLSSNHTAQSWTGLGTGSASYPIVIDGNDWDGTEVTATLRPPSNSTATLAILDGEDTVETMTIKGMDYATIQDIRLTQSSTNGLYFSNAQTQSINSATIQRVTSDNHGTSGIAIVSADFVGASDTVSDVTVDSCTSYSNQKAGIQTYGYYDIDGIIFSNNTAYENNQGETANNQISISMVSDPGNWTVGWVGPDGDGDYYHVKHAAVQDDEPTDSLINITDNTRLTEVGVKASLAAGKFWNDTTNGRVYIRDNPAGKNFYCYYGTNTNAEVYGNTSYGCLNAAGVNGVDGVGIYIDGYSSDADVYQNTVYENKGRGIAIRGGININVYANLLYNNSQDQDAATGYGIFIWEPGENITIYNNTLVNTEGYGIYSKDNADGASGTDGIDVENNIFSGFDVCLYDDNTGANLSNDYNLYYDYTTTVHANWGAEGGHVVKADPQLTANYRIMRGSVAYMAGLTIASVTGDRTTRSYRSPPSLGAFEVGSTHARRGFYFDMW